MSDSTSILGVSISKCSIKMQSERERTRVNFRPVTAQPIINNAPRHRREAIPHKPAKAGLDLWGVLRNCIGKDLTRIPLPVSFNEPLSMLQRITEDLDYSYLLDQAAEKDDICERLAYVGAYAVSCYSTTARRIAKPFNPLLGETFEFDRRQDLGWRSLAEQVSHHPPEAAHHADGLNWMMHQDLTINSHFRGHLNVVPVGFTHVKFRDGKAACSYQKVSTNVHNIILGNLWIENQGTMTIVNHVSGERAIIKFCGHNMFSPTREKKIKGVVLNKRGEARFCLKGYWDTHVNIGPVVAQKMKGNKLVIEAGESHTVWAVNKPITDHTMYNFTKLALELNEPNDEAVAPTDSRRRPDQRSMENGRWDEANRLKERLEQKQREAHKLVEAKAEKNGQDPAELLAQPRWFKKIHDQNTDTAIHLVLNQEYWECKERQDWSRCPDIF